MQYNPAHHHRKSIRLAGYDYAQAGLYFITICCADRQCVFGHIEQEEMVLTEYGQIACNEWLHTEMLRPQTALHEFIIMPNHMHGIIEIRDTGRGELHSPDSGLGECNLPKPVGGDNLRECNPPVCVGDDNTGECNSPLRVGGDNLGECNPPVQLGGGNAPQRSPSQTIGAMLRGYKSTVTKQLGLMGSDGKLWQRNYYEHIIRNQQSYNNIAHYIAHNPASWKQDKFYQ